MFQSKVLLISAEISALVCMALLFYMCVSGETEFDAPKALFALLCAGYAVMLQSIQQSIPWNNKNEEK